MDVGDEDRRTGRRGLGRGASDVASTLVVAAYAGADGSGRGDGSRRHPRSLRRHLKPSSDPVAMRPPPLVSIHEPSSTLGTIPARIAASASRPSPAHKSLEASSSKPSRKRSKTTRPPAAAPRTASRSLPAPPLSPARSRAPADIEIDDPMPTPADLQRALYEGITFERCVDISLSAVPYLFGLDACGFQFGFGGVAGLGGLGSGVGAMNTTTAAGGTARATAADDVNDFATVET
ncbi:hypothetical protein DFP72DRAFT_1091758 [Ephemerocybe angulata]|uniref:Uncharacterized protein n=1 Tax=Ephemerocybe angulata TaxID=980116 RepID=A0A8H6HFF9_9AGAR|nr:hypothetical protein DFP72DRAFT_1091758 [Tulosesus angulatus]